jgi:hypothetical protein
MAKWSASASTSTSASTPRQVEDEPEIIDRQFYLETKFARPIGTLLLDCGCDPEEVARVLDSSFYAFHRPTKRSRAADEDAPKYVRQVDLKDLFAKRAKGGSS